MQTTPYTITATVAGLDGSVTGTAYVTVNAFPDQVMIGSLVPSASEHRGQQGEFVITRVGPTTGSLTVNLSVGGTAQPGTDYQAFSAQV